MRTPNVTTWTVALLLLVSGHARAQTGPSLYPTPLLQRLSERVDSLQARFDLYVFGAVPPIAHADINGVSQSQPGVVAVVGWGFACGYDDARIVLVVDGIETTNGTFRQSRQDVVDAYRSSCANVTATAGVQGLVDMMPFETGSHQHTMQIRVYPPIWAPIGQPPFAMQSSAKVTFTTW